MDGGNDGGTKGNGLGWGGELKDGRILSEGYQDFGGGDARMTGRRHGWKERWRYKREWLWRGGKWKGRRTEG